MIAGCRLVAQRSTDAIQFFKQSFIHVLHWCSPDPLHWMLHRRSLQSHVPQDKSPSPEVPPEQCQNEELSSRFKPTCTKQVDGSCTHCLQVNLFTLRCAAAIAFRGKVESLFQNLPSVVATMLARHQRKLGIRTQCTTRLLSDECSCSASCLPSVMWVRHKTVDGEKQHSILLCAN